MFSTSIAQPVQLHVSFTLHFEHWNLQWIFLCYCQVLTICTPRLHFYIWYHVVTCIMLSNILQNSRRSSKSLCHSDNVGIDIKFITSCLFLLMCYGKATLTSSLGIMHDTDLRAIPILHHTSCFVNIILQELEQM